MDFSKLDDKRVFVTGAADGIGAALAVQSWPGHADASTGGSNAPAGTTATAGTQATSGTLATPGTARSAGGGIELKVSRGLDNMPAAARPKTRG